MLNGQKEHGEASNIKRGEIHNVLPGLQRCVKFNKRQTFIRRNCFGLLPWYTSKYHGITFERDFVEKGAFLDQHL